MRNYTTYFWGILISIMVSSCASIREQHSSLDQAHDELEQIANYEHNKNCILTTARPDEYLTRTNLLWVKDEEFIKYLESNLTNVAPQRIRTIAFILPRPMVFFGENGKISSAYLYYPDSYPDAAFQPASISLIGDRFSLTPSLSSWEGRRSAMGIVVPGFKKRASGFFEIFPKFDRAPIDSQPKKP